MTLNQSIRIRSVLWLLLAISPFMLKQQAIAHSGLFPDTFKYDDSNEGRKNSKNLKQSLAAVTSYCVDGLAGDYPCKNIHMKSHLSPSQMNSSGGNLNDIWGWTDVVSGKEIAIVGRAAGTSFVDISQPDSPVLLGYLAGHGNGRSSWRDIKVYQDHAFIVADGWLNFRHGLQIFDLTQLRNITPGSTLTETAHLGGFGVAHNIVINEDTGFAYIVGSNQCSGGLYMVDISNPTSPSFSGCFSADGYTHDAQCVTYQGPDSRYFNREICIAYNEDTITIVDVTDKANPTQLARETYQGAQYTHQGWFLNDNHSQLIMNDEADETRSGVNTTSYLYDVSVLTNPQLLGTYVSKSTSIDHNLYTRDNLVFESNYRSGLRILDSSLILSGQLTEKAYFDTIPCSDAAQFSGAWSSYIYFPSGNIVTSDIGTGLFVLEPDWEAINDPNNTPDDEPATSPACI